MYVFAHLVQGSLQAGGSPCDGPLRSRSLPVPGSKRRGFPSRAVPCTGADLSGLQAPAVGKHTLHTRHGATDVPTCSCPLSAKIQPRALKKDMSWVEFSYITFNIPVNGLYICCLKQNLKPLSVLNKALTICEQQVLRTEQVLLQYIIHMAVQSKATSCFKTRIYSSKQW